MGAEQQPMKQRRMKPDGNDAIAAMLVSIMASGIGSQNEKQ